MASEFIKYNKKTELLAPAGSKESFYAALSAGADAVYMAAQKFGARAYAGNFTNDEIFECADIAHLLGKRIYLTVNTLVKEKELDDLYEFAESGVCDVCDGFIIQDLGVASFFKENKPNIPIHASTQMSVTGPYAAELLKRNGFSRVVPAREISFDEIREIYDKTGMEIECFIHGAMCYSYSGQCLFSSVLGGRSGNRGRCAQPCRLPYRLVSDRSGEEKYPLSLKDMCTLEILPEIINSGVCSLKVEGRMKPAEYVYGVISIYRKYLDLIDFGKEYRIDKKDLETLSGLYVRGNLSHGYYDRHNGKEMVTVSSHGYRSDSDDKAESDNNRFKSLDCIPKIKVNFSALFKKGHPASLNAFCETSDGRQAYGYAEGEIVQQAQKTSIGRTDVIKSLKKLGNTVFSTDEDMITIDIENDVFYSLKGINELRRACLDDLSANLRVDIINNDSFSCKRSENAENQGFSPLNDKPGMYSILIGTASQVYVIHNLYDEGELAEICRIYIEESLLMEDGSDVLSHIDALNIPAFAALSQIRRKGDDISPLFILYEKGVIKGFLIRTLEDLCLVRGKYSDAPIITDFNLYTYNSKASAFLDTYSFDHTYPLELSNTECRELAASSDNVSERVIYGRAPLMITANCIRKTLKSCSHKPGFETIIDRKGIAFPVKCDCLHCMNVIYNSVPLLIPASDEVTSRIEFTDEDENMCRIILKSIVQGDSNLDIPHTAGWQNRPVM
ncbi:MAG: U32 family peptidase [Lachnospiraceae bacterium]|nr:U32 family peptidase [Lachnospiraceae bacterium]